MVRIIIPSEQDIQWNAATRKPLKLPTGRMRVADWCMVMIMDLNVIAESLEIGFALRDNRDTFKFDEVITLGFFVSV